jgi:hypothetical protein
MSASQTTSPDMLGINATELCLMLKSKTQTAEGQHTTPVS